MSKSYEYIKQNIGNGKQLILTFGRFDNRFGFFRESVKYWNRVLSTLFGGYILSQFSHILFEIFDFMFGTNFFSWFLVLVMVKMS